MLILFDKKPLSIPLNKIKRIQQGISDGEYGGILHIQYYISYENEAGLDEEVQIQRSTREYELWERFKKTLVSQNPTVAIQESSI